MIVVIISEADYRQEIYSIENKINAEINIGKQDYAHRRHVSSNKKPSSLLNDFPAIQASFFVRTEWFYRENFRNIINMIDPVDLGDIT